MNLNEVKSVYGLTFNIDEVGPMYRGAEVAKYDTIIKLLLEAGEDVAMIQQLMNERNKLKGMKITADEELKAIQEKKSETETDVTDGD